MFNSPLMRIRKGLGASGSSKDFCSFLSMEIFKKCIDVLKAQLHAFLICIALLVMVAVSAAVERLPVCAFLCSF